jgi:hypothetical protein
MNGDERVRSRHVRSVRRRGVVLDVDRAGMPLAHHLREPTICIVQDDAADELLGRDPLALLIGMLLDRQMCRRSTDARRRPGAASAVRTSRRGTGGDLRDARQWATEGGTADRPGASAAQPPRR